METVRLFVAVTLPAEIKRRLEPLYEALCRTGADCKWVEPGNYHFTLKFLGEVPVERLPVVKDGLAVAARGVAPFQVELAGAGGFPSLREPRVIWIGVGKGREALEQLARRVEESLAGRGFPREARPFSAHLTLGRARSRRGMEAVLQVLGTRQEETRGTFTVDHLVLMKSRLTPRGPIYHELATFTLGPVT